MHPIAKIITVLILIVLMLGFGFCGLLGLGLGFSGGWQALEITLMGLVGLGIAAGALMLIIKVLGQKEE